VEKLCKVVTTLGAGQIVGFFLTSAVLGLLISNSTQPIHKTRVMANRLEPSDWS
jgi:hypothetical protein